VPTVSPISEGQRRTSGREKKAISQSDYNPIHAVVILLYRTLQWTLKHDTRAGDGCIQIAAKPLQIKNNYYW